MPATNPAAPVPAKPISRFEAQRNLGLFGAHDYVSLIFLLISWTGFGVALFMWSEPVPWRWLIAWAVVNALVFQVWIVVLVYRALVFILDLHAEIALMPEAAARIAVGYFEGRKK